MISLSYVVKRYICRHCSDEYFSGLMQHYINGQDVDPDDSEFRAPTKCEFCGGTSFAVATYHKENSSDSIHYLSTDEYQASERLFEEIQRQPEFDPALRAKLIESRRARSAASMAAIRASANVPKCPTCGSTNVKPISTGEKAKGFFLAGIFSSNFGKSYQCGNCKYKW